MSTETPSNLLSSYDTLCARTYADSRVILLGEHHDSPASRRLVARVLNAVTPEIVAVESCPSQHSPGRDSEPNVSEGIDESIRYARGADIPVGLIDKSQMDLMTDFSVCPPEPIPFDPPQPDEHGDISASAIAEYREQIKQTCPQRYELLLTKRERCMAQYLATLATISTGPIVTILGASHLHAVADHLTDEALQPLDVPDSRLYTPQ